MEYADLKKYFAGWTKAPSLAETRDAVRQIRSRKAMLITPGGNPAASKGSIFSHQDVMGAIRSLRARGGRVIVVDPVRTGTAQAADQWISLRPGSDAALLMAVAHVLVRTSRSDPLGKRPGTDADGATPVPQKPVRSRSCRRTAAG